MSDKHAPETAAPSARAAAAPETAAPATDAPQASLLALVDRLADLLNRSDLAELEVGSGETSLILRKPSALAPTVVGLAGLPAGAAPAGPGAPGSAAAGPATAAGTTPSAPGAAADAAAAPARPSVKAPLTGVWYTSPSPGAPPYVTLGGEVAAGQVIGMIEAMKLFNEIKSDLAGRVVKICVESGAIVKAKAPLIEVEPL